jgi:hypothetical protein
MAPRKEKLGRSNPKNPTHPKNQNERAKNYGEFTRQAKKGPFQIRTPGEIGP